MGLNPKNNPPNEPAIRAGSQNKKGHTCQNDTVNAKEKAEWGWFELDSWNSWDRRWGGNTFVSKLAAPVPSAEKGDFPPLMREPASKSRQREQEQELKQKQKHEHE